MLLLPLLLLHQLPRGIFDVNRSRVIRLFYSNISMWSKDAEDYLAAETSHVIMVAEHRLDQAMFEDRPKSLIKRWWRRPYIQYAERTGDYKWATSGGLAILPRAHLKTSEIDAHLLQACTSGKVGGNAAASANRWVACTLRLKSVSLLLVVLYLKTNEELSEFNQAVLQQVFLLVSNFDGPCIIAGDWQMEPQTLIQSPWFARLNLKILAPTDTTATCKVGQRRLIDYFLVSEQIHRFLQISTDFAVKWDPHVGLRLDIPLRFRSHCIPTLYVPRPLPELSLVEGEHVFSQELWDKASQLANDHIAKWSNGTGILGADQQISSHLQTNQRSLSTTYCYYSTVIEFYALLDAGVDTSKAKMYLGRGAFPHVASKPAVARTRLLHTFSSPHAARWGTMESLVSWLVFPAVFRMGGEVGGKQAFTPSFPPHLAPNDKPSVSKLHRPIAQLKQEVMRLGPSWRRDVAPNCPIKAWEKWVQELNSQAILQQEAGYTQERVQVWIARARAQKHKAIQVRTAQARNDFKNFLAHDLANGASAAHALVKDKPFVEIPDPHAAHSAFATWANMWRDQRYEQRGATDWNHQLSELVQVIAKNGSNCQHRAKLKQLANQAEILEDISLDDLREATKSYPDKKGKGVDHWSTNFLSHLPDQMLNKVSNVLNKCQLFMCWPAQLMVNLITLIGKQLGGHRPIAKTPILYRLWNVVRMDKARQWSKLNVEEFDYAAAGKSAVFSGAIRCWINELATLLGRHAAALLWDLEKFFDTIAPSEVARQGLEASYPPLDMELALAMHTAPRLITLGGATSSVIIPEVSILAGCSRSVDFARLIMAPKVKDVVRRVKNVRNFTYVDDVAQSAIGKLQCVADAMVHAGTVFANNVIRAKLRISHTKSVVVASSPKLATIIANEIRKRTGVKLTTQTAGKDLGILNNPTARRNTTVQQNRLRTAKTRNARISKLAKSVRKATLLSHTGALPQAAWGAAVLGMAPTTVKQLRASMAAATGIVAHGRCPATAIAITMGPKRDPAVFLPMQQISLWIDLFRGDASCRTLAVRAWTTAYDRIRGLHLAKSEEDKRQLAIREACFTPELFAKRACWSAVFGPMTATMAVLYDQGWRVDSPARWTDPSGQDWLPDFTADKQPFVDLVGEFAEKLVWEAAAKSWCGKGLEAGVEWNATLALYNHIKLINSPPESQDDEQLQEELQDTMPMAHIWQDTASAWLELFLTGGYWPQARLNAMHPDMPSLCPRCGRCEESAFHLIWECPSNQAIDDPRIHDSQPLLYEARQGKDAHECLWLRGILPKDVIAISTPYLESEQLQYIGIAPSQPWPPGTYHTDAGGGAHNAYPALRRCGIGIAFTQQDDDCYTLPLQEQLLIWGAYSPLPGHLQTVTRAELFAIVIVVKNASGSVTVVTDSKVNADAFAAGADFCDQTANSDLWRQLWALLREKGMQLRVTWSKGHADNVDTFIGYNVSVRNLFGNLCADRLAGLGADAGQVYAQDAANLRWHYALVKKVQARAVVILSATMQKASSLIKQPRPSKLPRLTSAAHAMASSHRVTAMSRSLHCYRCLRQSLPTAEGRKQFLATMCNPDVNLQNTITLGNSKPIKLPSDRIVTIGNAKLHPEHSLCVFKGLYFCDRCGYNGSAKAQNLRGPCTARGEAAVRRVKLLRRGKLPSGLASWPNESAKRAIAELTGDLL